MPLLRRSRKATKARMLPNNTCFIFDFLVKKNMIQAGEKSFIHELINEQDEMSK
jgi:hypothetical protein